FCLFFRRLFLDQFKHHPPEALQEGREWLGDAQAQALLRAYGIPTVETDARLAQANKQADWSVEASYAQGG
ncbi:MAG: hypothetical protein B7X88_22200, partial [Polaromonas sp. 17-63-33]